MSTTQSLATQTTTAVSKAHGAVDTLRALLDRSKAQLALALPKHLTVERLIRVAITAVQKTPALLECDPLSIVGSLMTAAQLGLEPDGILGLAYMVPFYNNKTRQKEAQLQIGYKGFLALARRSGVVSSIYSEIVYTKDVFKVTLGTDHKLIHEPMLDMDDRGPIRGAYAVIFFKDGTHDFEYMSAREIEKIRDNSPGVIAARKFNRDTPWDSHPEEMFRKTPIRRLAKRMPLSVEDNSLAKAAMLDEYADTGISQGAAAEIHGADAPAIEAAADERVVSPVAQSKVDSLKAEIAAKRTTSQGTEPPPAQEPTPASANGPTVTGKLADVTQAKSTKGSSYLKLSIEGRKGTLFVWDAKLHGFLLSAKGQEVVLITKTDTTNGKSYEAVVDVRRVGDQEFEDGLPVIRRDTAHGDPLPVIDAESEPGGLPLDDDGWGVPGRE